MKKMKNFFLCLLLLFPSMFCSALAEEVRIPFQLDKKIEIPKIGPFSRCYVKFSKRDAVRANAPVFYLNSDYHLGYTGQKPVEYRLDVAFFTKSGEEVCSLIEKHKIPWTRLPGAAGVTGFGHSLLEQGTAVFQDQEEANVKKTRAQALKKLKKISYALLKVDYR